MKPKEERVDVSRKERNGPKGVTGSGKGYEKRDMKRVEEREEEKEGGMGSRGDAMGRMWRIEEEAEEEAAAAEEDLGRRNEKTSTTDRRRSKRGGRGGEGGRWRSRGRGPKRTSGVGDWKRERGREREGREREGREREGHEREGAQERRGTREGSRGGTGSRGN